MILETQVQTHLAESKSPERDFVQLPTKLQVQFSEYLKLDYGLGPGM